MTRVTWREWIPTGGGLRDEDWHRRHRLLTMLLAASAVLLTAYGVLRENAEADRNWLYAVLLILPCVVAAHVLRSRRLAAVLVALGYALACAGLVSVTEGLTEAHFSFFVAVAALALYRDWTPFGVFLLATVAHHALIGSVFQNEVYSHSHAARHPLLWALIHGAAVLAAAAFQVVAWALTEDEERRAQDNLDAQQAQLNVAFDESPVPTALFSPEGHVLRTNRAYRDWMRLPDELPAGFKITDIPLRPVDSSLPELLHVLRSSKEPLVGTREYVRTDTGESLWVETHGAPLYDRQGNLRLLFVHCLDVTTSRRHEAELEHQIRHDALTGLLSRAGFEADLGSLMASLAGPASVLYLDVDRFKSINDEAGHGAGDAVLRALAVRLKAAIPPGALVARIGGDEFVVAIPGGPELGRAVAQQVLTSFAMPMGVAGDRLRFTASIGLAMAADAGDAEQAVLAADTAMYAAKRAGGNRLAVFNEEMRVKVQRRIAAEARLREALGGDRVTTLPVWFQPIVDARTGRITGAESLVRMRTPQGQVLAPGDFIESAEETGMVVPLGEHVLSTALEHLRYWDTLGYVSVNVSPRQLSEPGFVATLSALLARSPWLDPGRLVLEITETAALTASVDLQARLHAIKDLGVRIALDDFGTGYSSLTWLQSVPADVVKLDRSFVAGLATDPKKSSIISAVLWLAQSLGMSVVAEGVEEMSDWQALRELGCPALQGYYFSRPLPAPEFDSLLRSGADLVPTDDLLGSANGSSVRAGHVR